MTNLIVDLFAGGGGASEGIRMALGQHEAMRERLIRDEPVGPEDLTRADSLSIDPADRKKIEAGEKRIRDLVGRLPQED